MKIDLIVFLLTPSQDRFNVDRYVCADPQTAEYIQREPADSECSICSLDQNSTRRRGNEIDQSVEVSGASNLGRKLGRFDPSRIAYRTTPCSRYIFSVDESFFRAGYRMGELELIVVKVRVTLSWKVVA